MYSRGTGWYLNRKPELNPEIKLNDAYPYRFITTLTIIYITSQFYNQQFHSYQHFAISRHLRTFTTTKAKRIPETIRIKKIELEPMSVLKPP